VRNPNEPRNSYLRRVQGWNPSVNLPEPTDPDEAPGGGAAGKSGIDVLIVDDDEHVLEAIGDALRSGTADPDPDPDPDPGTDRRNADRAPQDAGRAHGSSGPAPAAGPRRIHHAPDLATARRILDQRPIDLVLADIKLADGDGLDFAGELRRTHPLVRTIIITGHPSVDHAVEAMRCGAVDFLSKPLDVNDLNQRVDRALALQRNDAQRAQRMQRLRRLCKQLNSARHEVTQQVDILCNDLVTAYQELAGQMQALELTSDLRTTLNDELDLEQTMRRVLEFVIQRVGPTNAVIFLPSAEDGYSVGGYVNYAMEKQAMPIQLGQLAVHAAPCIGEEPEVTWLTTDQEIADWLEAEAHWLGGQHVLTVGCCDEDDGEVLATLLLFRPAAEPYQPADVELLEALAPLLTRHLVRLIRIHHRHKDLFDDEDEGGAFL